MKITQISVFLENKKGRLFEATKALGDAGVDIKALTIAENEDFGVLRMVVDKPQDALAAFKKNGFVASLTDIVAVEVDDTPGGLARILAVFNKNDLNVEYMYAFVEKTADKAIVVFRFDDPDKAIVILTKNNVKIVGKKEIQTL
ncbi:MAG TPA: ACT domain-containing protein [Candidatus Omnitrophota bacterium]|nr:ACT domain-containing protein [Candidatus Omnitrophota bacterium]HPD84262.1 ACT domain-containing protein [Candidatus Omnitrophota bacterium]HRZ03118.1 ACT domain-containing protein [Candidatus Omnitrophota bacterium]